MTNQPDHKAATIAIETFLRALGCDPSSPSLQETPQRVASLFISEWLNGYTININDIFHEMLPAPAHASTIVVGPLHTHMICPHHLTLATGAISVAYQPHQHIVGFGALAQLVDAYAHRLVLQEELGSQIAHALVEKMQAKGAACLLRFRHSCLEHHSAGSERKQGAVVQSMVYAGAFSEYGFARTEVTNLLLQT